ncbi:macrophage mannose receptor 1-like, partial [Engraulis encrasicolus]|uniref:macrophage mannose receptor 1-like n=1 Tax=Engraulis encrasicolus TaxID=184585 RepID=UPI002FD22C0E
LLGVCDLSSVPRQFHVVKKVKTWTEAQQYCRDEFTDLATIDNMADIEEIRRVIQDAGVRYAVWIGLKKRDSPKWQWSLADDGFYGENEAEFQNWDEDVGQPNGRPGEEDCGCIDLENGKWHDLCCIRTRPFICYNDKLVLVNQNKTWMEALQYCRQHHVDLVSVTSEQTQRWVEGWAKGASSPHVWLGLRYHRSFGFWFWINGYSVCYDNFASSGHRGPDLDIAVAAVDKHGGQWVSFQETKQLNFICTNEESLLCFAALC